MLGSSESKILLIMSFKKLLNDRITPKFKKRTFTKFPIAARRLVAKGHFARGKPWQNMKKLPRLRPRKNGHQKSPRFSAGSEVTVPPTWPAPSGHNNLLRCARSWFHARDACRLTSSFVRSGRAPMPLRSLLDTRVNAITRRVIILPPR